MDGLIENLGKQIDLKEDEENGLWVDTSSSSPVIIESDLLLVGRVATQKIILAHTIKSNIARLLQPIKGFEFFDLGSNKFVVKFFHGQDRKHALSGSPWLLDRNVVLLMELQPGVDPKDINIDTMQIVVRIHQIPLDKRLESVAVQIGNYIGMFVELINPSRELLLIYED